MSLLVLREGLGLNQLFTFDFSCITFLVIKFEFKFRFEFDRVRSGKNSKTKKSVQKKSWIEKI